MQYGEAPRLLQTYLSENWTATPLAYTNVDGRYWSEVGQPVLPTGEEDYITVRTHIFHSEFITVPGTCRRYHGTLFLAAATRKGSGTRALETYISDLIALLEGKTLSNTDGGELRVWTLTGNAEYAIEDWFINEIALGFSFERFVLT